MRKVMFRGKTMLSIDYLDMIGADHDEGWIIGNLITNNGSPYIVGEIIEATDEYTSLEFWVQVEPESVGQYTGLKDKHGVGIYEGDIVEYGLNVGLVTFKESGFKFGFSDGGSDFMGELDETGMEIIGNIYEEPDLLEVLE